jgi:hypothetical protein
VGLPTSPANQRHTESAQAEAHLSEQAGGVARRSIAATSHVAQSAKPLHTPSLEKFDGVFIRARHQHVN